MSGREDPTTSADNAFAQTFENFTVGGNARVQAGNTYSGGTFNYFHGPSAQWPTTGTGQENKVHNRVPFMVKHHTSQSFVGREKYVSRITSMLTLAGKHNRVALYGFGGIGKTRIALEVADNCRKQTYAVFWLYAGSKERIQQDFLNIANEIEIPDWDPKAPVSDRLRLIKRQMESEDVQQWLLIIDNADGRDSLWSTSDPFIDFLPYTSYGSILLTTRNENIAYTFNPECRERIPKFTLEESKALLAKRLTNSTDKERDTLADLLDNVPLALVQAASYISRRAFTITSYIRLYQKSDNHKFDLLREEFHDDIREPEAKNSVAMTLQISFRHINENHPVAAQKLMLMSHFSPQAIPETLLRSEVEKDDGELYESMGLLESFSLVSKRSESIDIGDQKIELYDLHRLVHIAAKCWLKTHLNHSNKENLTFQALDSIEGNLPPLSKLRFLEHYIPHSLAIIGVNWNGTEERETCDISPSSEEIQLDNTSCVQNPRLGERLANFIERLAYLLANRNEVVAAIDMLKRAIAIHKRLTGSRSRLYLSARSCLASWLEITGMVSEAERIIHITLETQTREFGPNDMDALVTLGILGDIISRTDKPKAEELYRQVLQAYPTDTLSSNEPIFGILINLLYLLMGQGKFDEVEKRCSEALKLHETNSEHQIVTMLLLDCRADNFFTQGLYDEALKQYRKALQLSLKVFGPKNIDEMSFKYSISHVLCKLQRYEEAEATCRDALDLRMEIVDSSSPTTEELYHYLRFIYTCQNKHHQASEISRDILELRRHMIGCNDSTVYDSMHLLSEDLFAAKKYREAESKCRTVLRWRKEHLGRKHLQTLETLESLARCLRSQDKFVEAKDIYEELISKAKQVYGEENTDTWRYGKDYLYVLGRLGRYREAEHLSKQLLKSWSKILGGDSAEHKWAAEQHEWVFEQLAWAFMAQEKFVEAENAFKEVLERRKILAGDKDKLTLSAMYNLSYSMYFTEKYNDAKELCKAALKSQLVVLGEEDEDTICSRNLLQAIRHETGKQQHPERKHDSRPKEAKKVTQQETKQTSNSIKAKKDSKPKERRSDTIMKYSKQGPRRR